MKNGFHCKETLLASQINFILHFNDKTALFLTLKTWLPINHLTEKNIPVIFMKNPRVSRFNPRMQICEARTATWWIHKGKSHKNLFQRKMYWNKQHINWLLEAKKPFLFHCVRENKKHDHVKINYHTQQNKFQDQTRFWKTFPWIMKHEIDNKLSFK